MSFSYRAHSGTHTSAARISTKERTCVHHSVREKKRTRMEERCESREEVKEMRGTDKLALTNAHPARGKD